MTFTQRRIGVFIMAHLFLVPWGMAIEEPAYTVVQSAGNFELRQYASYVVAETEVTAQFKEAGNIAFRKLFRYIQGENQTRTSIAMTAPVSTQKNIPGEKIAMTAPVLQTQNGPGYSISFTLPSLYTLANAPRPNDPSILLRQIPARTVGVLRYSGSWSETRFQAKVTELQHRLETHGLQPTGKPLLARYNSPFALWFMRRNEVHIELAP